MRKTFQLWLLVFVTAAFALTLTLSYLVQTGQARAHSETLIRDRLTDACEQIERNNANLLLVEQENRDAAQQKALIFAEFLNEDYSRASDAAWMQHILTLIGVDELHVTDENGIIRYASTEETIGYDMASAAQSAAFLPLLERPGESLVQPPMKRGLGDDRIVLYAGVGLAEGRGVAQIGFFSSRLQQSMEVADIKNLAPGLHIGINGGIAVIKDGLIVSSGTCGNIGKRAAEVGLDDALLSDGAAHYCMIGGERFYCLAEPCGDYMIVGRLPDQEVFTTRQETSTFLVVSNLIVFLTAFALISWLVQRVVISGIYSVNDSLLKITSGDLDERVNVLTNHEFRLLSNGINATVDSLKNAMAETKRRIAAELDFAKSIQFSSVPNVFPPFPDNHAFDIFASMEAAKEVGGDFYDFFLLDANRLAFIIADVSGKGVGAAMYMMRAKTQLKHRTLAGGALDKVVFDVNNCLCEDNRTGMFVTAFIGVCDFSSGRMDYVNAGHNPPLLQHPGGQFAYMEGKRGFVLGGMENARYLVNSMPLLVGDRLFLYTDGVTEAVDPSMALFGEERLRSYLNAPAQRDMDVTALLGAVRAELLCYANGAEQADDITMLGIQIRDIKQSARRMQLSARVENIDTVQTFVDAAIAPFDVPDKTNHHIHVAVDELFTNVASYAYGGRPGEAIVECDVHDGVMTFSITDCGMPYNPLEKPDPDVTLSGDARVPGGLGIFLAKRLMDSMTYTFFNGLNRVTITKKL